MGVATLLASVIMGAGLAGGTPSPLFAGSGAIGLEALSRGAASCLFVDESRHAAAVIGENLRATGLTGGRVVRADVFRHLAGERGCFELVFADPPYELKWLKDLPDLVTQSGIIKENGFFILEHPKALSFNSHNLFFEHRNYGGVNFSFFRGDKHVEDQANRS